MKGTCPFLWIRFTGKRDKITDCKSRDRQGAAVLIDTAASSFCTGRSQRTNPESDEGRTFSGFILVDDMLSCFYLMDMENCWLQSITRANWEQMEAEKKMCDALKELFSEELKEADNNGKQIEEIRREIE